LEVECLGNGSGKVRRLRFIERGFRVN